MSRHAKYKPKANWRDYIDMDRYFAATEEIRAKYENDRIVAAGRNALPRN